MVAAAAAIAGCGGGKTYEGKVRDAVDPLGPALSAIGVAPQAKSQADLDKVMQAAQDDVSQALDNLEGLDPPSDQKAATDALIAEVKSFQQTLAAQPPKVGSSALKDLGAKAQTFNDQFHSLEKKLGVD
jgi:hypothetical protein